jgi:hypothetical protein
MTNMTKMTTNQSFIIFQSFANKYSHWECKVQQLPQITYKLWSMTNKLHQYGSHKKNTQDNIKIKLYSHCLKRMVRMTQTYCQVIIIQVSLTLKSSVYHSAYVLSAILPTDITCLSHITSFLFLCYRARIVCNHNSHTIVLLVLLCSW